MQRIFRHQQLYGEDSVFGISRTLYFDKYVGRPGAGPFIPGTRIKRLKVIKLGERARGVAESEVQRVLKALAEA